MLETDCMIERSECEFQAAQPVHSPIAAIVDPCEYAQIEMSIS